MSTRAPGARLRQVRHWVFDMDGTLTRAVHDFALIRRELEILEQADILQHLVLQHLAALPAEEGAAKHAWLLEHERELALGAVAAPGVPALLRTLHAAGCRLAVLMTRNAQELARLTLREIGVEDLFEDVAILGRDEAPPKPHPGGLQHLAAYWGVWRRRRWRCSAITHTTCSAGAMLARPRCCCMRTIRGRRWPICTSPIARRCWRGGRTRPCSVSCLW